MSPPTVFKDVKGMRAFVREQRSMGKQIGFVPTMGYLHDGHVSLVEAARECCEVVVASIYVNPTQFSKNEDFGVYPRSIEGDLEKLEAAGCAAVFMPSSLYHTASPINTESARLQTDSSLVVGSSEAYNPDAHETWVSLEHLSTGLCAKSRPHFFRGVCTVVTKLFNIVEPDLAFFGKKDYQQWRVIERMVRDLDFGIEVVGMPIMREDDGLAMSSRNALLSPEDRARCPCIHQSLCQAQQDGESGAATSPQQLAQQVAATIAAQGGRVDYVEVVDARTLQPVAAVGEQLVLVAVAAYFGSVRLIDNIEIKPRMRV